MLNSAEHEICHTNRFQITNNEGSLYIMGNMMKYMYTLRSHVTCNTKTIILFSAHIPQVKTYDEQINCYCFVVNRSKVFPCK